jgi:TonB family protein
MLKVVRYFPVLFAFSVLLCLDAGAEQRFPTDTRERFFPGTAAEQYARDVYLELMRVQSQMVDKKYERHRRNATMEVSFTVGKNGRVRSLKIPRPSGDPELDQIVIGAIQSTRFSPPPPGADPDFLLPLRFRLD